MIFREGWFGADTKQNAPNINFKVVPYIPEKKDYAPGNLLPGANMISKNSKHQEICFDLFEAMARPEADVMLHEAAGYPPFQKATYSMENDYFSSLSYDRALMDALEKSVSPSYFFSELHDVAYIVGEEIVACLHGESAKVCVDRSAKRIDEVLKGMKYNIQPEMVSVVFG